MSEGSPICFGDIVQLRAKSAFAGGDGVVTLSFLEQPGKDQPLLVVPPKDTATGVTLVEAEFIVAPVRGDKQQAPGTRLTYRTPFTLRTNETDRKKKEEVFYSLNNKVTGHKDGVTLQPAMVKGEMYLTLEKEGFTAETIVHEGDAEFQLVVVDSNRIRKSLNHPLAQFSKPKTVGALVGCGVAKGSQPLWLSIARLKKPDGRTHSFMKEAKFRRASMESLDSFKADETGRPEVADSDPSEAADSRNRLGSLASQPSTSALSAPAENTAAAVPTESAEPSAASERGAEHSLVVLTEAATSVGETPTETPVASAAVSTEAPPTTESATVKPKADAKTEPATKTEPAAKPTTAKPEAAEKEKEKTEAKTDSTAKPTTEAEVVAAESASTAEVVISEAFTAVSEAPVAVTTTVSSTTVDELDADAASDRAACVGGLRCVVM